MKQEIGLRKKCAAEDNEINENKILGCARKGRAARLKQQAKCIELRDERGNANEVY